MNTKMTKFLMTALLALGVSGAWAAIESQAEFVEACAAAVDGSEITLGQGEFSLSGTGGKSLKIIGVGTETKISAGSFNDGNQGVGVFVGSLEFVSVRFTGAAATYNGFTGAGTLVFRNVTFDVGFSNWGNRGGNVSFYNCTFNQKAKGGYCVQELRCNSSGSWPLVTYLFDGCKFNCGFDGRFINAYKQGGETTKIDIVVKNCEFNNTGASSKAALNLKDTSDGCTIDLTFVGTNTANGPFPSSAPSALFQTTSTGWGTVYLKDDDDAEPRKIYENNAKTTDWIDPNGYTPAPAGKDEVEVVLPETVPVTDAEGKDVPSAAQAEATKVVDDVKKELAANKSAGKAEETGVTEIANTSKIVEELNKKAGSTVVTSETKIAKFVKVELTSTKVAVEDTTAAFKSIVFEVTPQAEVTVTPSEGAATTVQATIPNSEITQPITFRLPLPNYFTISAIVKHEGDPDRLLPVKGETNGKYVEVTVTHFSAFEVEPSDEVSTTVSSSTVLGIKRRANVSGTVAIGVPWLGTDGQAIKVKDLISKDCLLTDDKLLVWNGTGYDAWRWTGTTWEAFTPTRGVAASIETPLVRGKAAWLERAAAGSVIQIGQYNEGAITTTPEKGASLFKAKHSLLINPKSVATPLSAIEGAEGDQIVILTSPKVRLECVNGQWGTTKNVFNPATFVTEKQFTEYTDPIPADTGFWYISAGGAPTIQW